MPVPTLLAALTALVGAVACTEDEPAAAPDTGCASTVHDASFAVEVDAQIALLDQAMVRCPSLGALVSEMERYPRIVGYDIPAFVELRCRKTTDAAVAGSAACLTFAGPATTIADPDDELVFVGETLDGRVVEIRPDADTKFVDGVPEVVQRTVDIAIEAGCDGVYAQRDQWAARADEPGFGDEASVYAVHAQNVANYIGCDARPLAGTTATTAPAPTQAPTTTTA